MTSVPVRDWATQREVSLHVKCLNHPETTQHLPLSMEKLSSMKSVPGAKRLGTPDPSESLCLRLQTKVSAPQCGASCQLAGFGGGKP